jgi:rhodanese-related sulfurtransferase
MTTNTYSLIAVIALAIIFSLLKEKMGKKGPNGAEYHKLDGASLKEWIDDKEDFFLVDVRSEDEYKVGHIKTAKNIPLQNLKIVAESTFKNKDDFIVVYCLSGKRALSAAKTLIKMGYTEVYDFGSVNKYPDGTTKKK